MEEATRNKIISMGCQDYNIASRAALLHLHLAEELLMYNIELHYNKESNIVYIEASRTKNSPLQIFIPHNASDPLNLEHVRYIQELLKSESINFALMESDSTIVIYNLTSGMKQIKTADELTKNNSRDERRHYIQSELKKQKSALLEQAQQQTVIDD